MGIVRYDLTGTTLGILVEDRYNGERFVIEEGQTLECSIHDAVLTPLNDVGDLKLKLARQSTKLLLKKESDRFKLFDKEGNRIGCPNE